MDKNHKICCVTGHRPKGFPWNYNYDPGEKYDSAFESTLSRAIRALIADGYDYFICGGAIGVDLTFGLEVIHLRDFEFPHIKLEVAVPCPGQSKSWSKAEQAMYKELIELADEVNVISPNYTKFCFHKRNEYMVDKSDFVLVVWNEEEKGGTYYTYQYAVRKNKPTHLILLHNVRGLADLEEISEVRDQIKRFGEPVPPADSPAFDEFVKKHNLDADYEYTEHDKSVVQAAIDKIDLVNERRKKYLEKRRPIP